MKKVIKYINNNIFEFRAILDGIIFITIIYIAAIACKFVILNIA